jgi:hypothetical protein
LGSTKKHRCRICETFRELSAAGFAATLPRRLETQPLVYTPTTTGYRYAAAFGLPVAKRIRPVDERDKANNTLFLQHTVAISDVLIAAKLLAKTHPAIELSHLYTERSLKRKIAVPLADNRSCYIEPDASVEFLLTETWHEPPQTWQDFFHIEVYRHLPMESRFKVDTGTHEALFKTEALSIAVFCETVQQAGLLKRWTEDALDVFLAPVWERAFGTTKTPLLVLE